MDLEELEGFTPDGRTWKLVKGIRYRATISLNFFEAFAGNEFIASKFTDNGFSEVTVTGSGSSRIVEGVWNMADIVIPLDSHIATVEAV